jgi:hypothetical protein
MELIGRQSLPFPHFSGVFGPKSLLTSYDLFTHSFFKSALTSAFAPVNG